MGVRASDAERERTVASLHRAYASGRLTVGDLERRVARAYTATWRSELRAITRDLPFELPVDRRKVVAGVDRFQRALLRFHAWSFVAFNTVLVSMWAWGGGHEFWPAFSLVPGGALLLWHNKGSKAASRRLSRGRGRRAIAA
ncbi:MAG: hypothetical protein QOG63_1065 [Thermoleophilaceae bacterium]|jgi:hypothetical protein|nr:hypothetical protein [Thermoleophilaceae bacterium]